MNGCPCGSTLEPATDGKCMVCRNNVTIWGNPIPIQTPKAPVFTGESVEIYKVSNGYVLKISHRHEIYKEFGEVIARLWEYYGQKIP